jgi:pimeloyl-ACP methyl ester carboxylesterase
VLGIDYRGFGQSTDELPSEDIAHEDATAAWRWLAQRQPGAPRFVYGHSLGSAIAVRLAAEVADAPAGLIAEGAFTSIPDLVGTFKYGWLPLGPLISQRFDAASRIGTLRVPVIVVHGADDGLVPATLGRSLYELAPGPKRFVLVEGGSHHNASAAGLDELRAAVGAVFGAAAPSLHIGLNRQP